MLIFVMKCAADKRSHCLRSILTEQAEFIVKNTELSIIILYKYSERRVKLWKKKILFKKKKVMN